jgi:large subunit ribosomal protein L35
MGSEHFIASLPVAGPTALHDGWSRNLKERRLATVIGDRKIAVLCLVRDTCERSCILLFEPTQQHAARFRLPSLQGPLSSRRFMPKPIARSKTKKAVAKRFKITARGKVLRAQSARRHLLSAKNAKRKRQLSKAVLVDDTDVSRIKANLPFG